MERNLYTRYSWQGVGLMMIIDLLLFGAAGSGGVGGADGLDSDHGRRHHQWRSALLGLPQLRGAGRQHQHFSVGIIIAGEELHNNHHTYPTSAKLSVKPYEFDIGWIYIRLDADGWPGQGQEDAAQSRHSATFGRSPTNRPWRP